MKELLEESRDFFRTNPASLSVFGVYINSIRISEEGLSGKFVICLVSVFLHWELYLLACSATADVRAGY